MEELIRLEAVSYTYEDSRAALCDCSLRLVGGERIAVLGGNGAGKSTLFLLLSGVLSPQQGTIFCEGTAVGRSEREKNRLHRRVGLVFQDPTLQFLAGTVEEEVSFGPMNLDLDESDVRRRVETAIQALHLETLRERAPHELSGGEARRVAIADGLAMEPRVLLLDEPAAFLDAVGCRRLEATLTSLNEQGLTLLVATHDVDFVWRWAERVLLFHEGKLLCDTTPEALFRQEDVLQRCGLDAPILFEMGQALALNPLPREKTAFIEAVRKGWKA